MTIPPFDPLVSPRVASASCGRIRQRPDDFLVYEIPMYEPCGEGEHLYLRIRKTGVSHDELIRIVAETWGVRKNDIGFAGMKDSIAVAEQTVSIHLPDRDVVGTIEDPRLTVIWSERHGNKLRRGHLGGNRFVIRIRDVNPLRVPEVWAGMQQLATEGVPNAFGVQRFGLGGDNHVLGALMIAEDWSGILERLLEGNRGRMESRLRAAIEEGKTPAEACRLIPGRLRRLWNDALQSALFNVVLGARLEQQDWARPMVDDLVWNHQTRRTFIMGLEDLEDSDTQRRIEEGLLVPTGPMWGRAMRAPGPSVEIQERAIADAIDPGLVPLLVDAGRSRGTRRPLAVPLRHPSVVAGVDEHGGCITVQFELPPGAYATTVLTELMGSEVDSSVPATVGEER